MVSSIKETVQKHLPEAILGSFSEKLCWKWSNNHGYHEQIYP